MSERKWRSWEVAGLLVTLAAGNLLHFVYDWSGGSPAAAVFAAVNESTWEHMKLLATPWLLWTLPELLAVGRGGSVLSARAAGLLAGLAAIPLLYYGYQGVLGRDVMWLDVLIFQLAVLIAFRLSWQLQSSRCLSGGLWQLLGALLLAGLWALFVLWTFQPPELPLFADPESGLRGVARVYFRPGRAMLWTSCKGG